MFSLRTIVVCLFHNEHHRRDGTFLPEFEHECSKTFHDQLLYIRRYTLQIDDGGLTVLDQLIDTVASLSEDAHAVYVFQFGDQNSILRTPVLLQDIDEIRNGVQFPFLSQSLYRFLRGCHQ